MNRGFIFPRNQETYLVIKMYKWQYDESSAKCTNKDIVPKLVTCRLRHVFEKKLYYDELNKKGLFLQFQ